MSLGTLVYNNISRRFSTILLASAFGAYVFNYTLEGATNFYWDTKNANKQWKDVKKTLTAAEE